MLFLFLAFYDLISKYLAGPLCAPQKYQFALDDKKTILASPI